MKTLALLGTTLGFAFAAGLNLYATIVVIGVSMRFGWVAPPPLAGSVRARAPGGARRRRRDVPGRVPRRQDSRRGSRLGRDSHRGPPGGSGMDCVEDDRRRGVARTDRGGAAVDRRRRGAVGPRREGRNPPGRRVGGRSLFGHRHLAEPARRRDRRRPGAAGAPATAAGPRGGAGRAGRPGRHDPAGHPRHPPERASEGSDRAAHRRSDLRVLGVRTRPGGQRPRRATV